MARARSTASECSNSRIFGNDTGRLHRNRASRSISPDSSSVSHTVATCEAVKFNVGNANNGDGANIGWWWWWWLWWPWWVCGVTVWPAANGAGGLAPPVPRPTAIEGRTTARLVVFGAIFAVAHRVDDAHNCSAMRLQLFRWWSLFIFNFLFYSIKLSQNPSNCVNTTMHRIILYVYRGRWSSIINL